MINIIVSFGNLKVYKNGSAVSQVQRENDHPKIKSNSEEKTTIRSKRRMFSKIESLIKLNSMQTG